MSLSKEFLESNPELLDTERDEVMDLEDDLDDWEDDENLDIAEDSAEDSEFTNGELSISYLNASKPGTKFSCFLKIEKMITITKIKNLEKTLISKAKSVSIDKEIIELPCIFYLPLTSKQEILGSGYTATQLENKDHIGNCVFDNIMEHNNMIDVIKDDLFLDDFELEKICQISEHHLYIGRGYNAYLVIPGFEDYNLEFDRQTKSIYSTGNVESKNLKKSTFFFNKNGDHLFDASQSNNYELKENPESSSFYHKYKKTEFIPEIRYTVTLSYRDNDIDKDQIKALFEKVKNAEKVKRTATSTKKVKKPIAYASHFEDLFILLMEHQVDKLGVSLKGWTFHIGGQGGCIRKDCSEPMIDKILEKDDLLSLASFLKKRRTNYKDVLKQFNWSKHPKIEELIGLM